MSEFEIVSLLVLTKGAVVQEKHKLQGLRELSWTQKSRHPAMTA